MSSPKSSHTKPNSRWHQPSGSGTDLAVAGQVRFGVRSSLSTLMWKYSTTPSFHHSKYVIIIILYAYVACRANSMDVHLSLSFATSSISMDFPSFFASYNIVRLHVSLGRHFLPLSGVHLADVLVILFRCFLKTCPTISNFSSWSLLVWHLALFFLVMLGWIFVRASRS